MIYDIFIIGGGINGCGVARDASGRGLKICLAEMDDLASGTSSASTKLIHGGLRYLKYFDFKLVKEALKERDVLLKIMPHICWPMRFLIPLESFRINNFFVKLITLVRVKILAPIFFASTAFNTTKRESSTQQSE